MICQVGIDSPNEYARYASVRHKRKRQCSVAVGRETGERVPVLVVWVCGEDIRLCGMNSTGPYSELLESHFFLGGKAGGGFLAAGAVEHSLFPGRGA